MARVRWKLTCVIAALNVACGTTAQDNGAGGGTTNAGGAGTGGAASSGAGAGGSESGGAGTGGSGTSGATGGSETGGAGSGGAATGGSAAGVPGANHPACGGDCAGSPVGEWGFVVATSCASLPSWPLGKADQACQYEFTRLSDGSLGVNAGFIDLTYLSMTRGTLSIVDDGTYAIGVLYTTSTQLLHAADCRQTGGAIASCDEIQEQVGALLAGEGYGRNHVCTEEAGGGCLCTVDLTMVMGQAGTWLQTQDGKLLLTPNFVAPEAPPPEPTTYCASDTTLALGAELHLSSYAAIGVDVVFQRVDCADGLQGDGEEGPDCGGVCLVDCP
ncbi:MAG TPA: hypothetical protein VM686_16090 [Polyangiaceae bacterium]|nr:hypothetical protein [Polyangiaceae bacterium]